MSDTPKIKLNLKALEKPSGVEGSESIPSNILPTSQLGEVSPESAEISVPTPTATIAKISLGGIKKSAQTPSMTPTLEETKTPEENISPMSEKTLVTENISQESIGSENSSLSLDEHINSVGNSQTLPSTTTETQNISDTSELQKEIPQEEKPKDPEPVQFQNYESGFKKQSGNVLKKIQNFRYTPKTRKGLVIGLISLCVGTIGFLMIFFPEKHSLSIYKASILNIATQDISQGSENITQSTPDIQTPDISIPEENSLNEEETENEPEVNAQDESAIRQEKKEKLRQHLIKKYSSS